MDVESSDWILQKLECSISTTLLISIKQSYDGFDKASKGGITLFKLLADKIDTASFEHKKLLQDYVTDFRLDRFPGENVTSAASCFRATT